MFSAIFDMECMDAINGIQQFGVLFNVVSGVIAVEKKKKKKKKKRVGWRIRCVLP